MKRFQVKRYKLPILLLLAIMVLAYQLLILPVKKSLNILKSQLQNSVHIKKGISEKAVHVPKKYFIQGGQLIELSNLLQDFINQTGLKLLRLSNIDHQPNLTCQVINIKVLGNYQQVKVFVKKSLDTDYWLQLISVSIQQNALYLKNSASIIAEIKLCALQGKYNEKI